MVDLFEYRRKRRLDIGEVHHPPRSRTRLARHMDFDAKRMSMQARALVSLRDMREPMRRFDLEDFENIHIRS